MLVLALSVACSPTALHAAPDAAATQPPATSADAGAGIAQAPEEKGPVGLTEPQKQALAAAIERGDDVAMESIVIAAIARASERASEIVKDAVRLAPDRATVIVKAVQGVFPNLSERVATAANSVLQQIEAGRSVAGAEPRPLGPSPEAPRVDDAETQPTAEKKVAEDDTPQHKWSGELALGGSFRTGARHAAGTNFGGEIEHQYAKWTNTVDASFDYSRSEGVTNTHRLRSRGKSKRAITERLYGFGLVGYEEDRFNGFDYQLSEAGGLGYRIIDGESFTWDLEAGPAWRQSKISRTGELLSELFFRGGSEFVWSISDTAEFSNETTLLYSGDKVEIRTATDSYFFQESNDLTNVSALDMTVIGNLAARLSAEVSYTSEPPEGTPSTDTLSKIALVQNF
jgi:putative salt-induced outer membrane protein